MDDLTTKLADALRRIHEIYGGDAWEYRQIAIEALALYDAAKAQPKQAAEPVAWGMLDKETGLILDVICPATHDELEGDYTIPLYAAPVAQAEPRKPLTDDQHRRMCALYFGDCSARMHDFLIEYGKRVEAAHGFKENP